MRADAGAELIEVDANGLRFSVRVSGHEGARPVVLLHGFPESSTCWLPLMAALADAGYRAVAPDQRGYSPGARPEPVEAYRMPELVGDVLALKDAMELGPVDVVGHDWGGMVAWHLGASHPAAVRSLTAVSTPHPAALAAVVASGDKDQVRRLGYIETFRRPVDAERLLLGPDGEAREAREAHDDGGDRGVGAGEGLRRMLVSSGLAPAVAGEYVAAMCRPGALTAALNWYRALDPDAAGPKVAPVVVPTLYVWSTGDVAFGRAAAERTAEYVAGRYALVVLEGVSHWVPEEAPAELSRLVLRHLEASG